MCDCKPDGFVCDEMHHHKCQDCGTQWGHALVEGMCGPCYNERHKCPNCGKDERGKIFLTQAERNADWFFRLLTT